MIAAIVWLVALTLLVGGLAFPPHVVKGPVASVLFLALFGAGSVLAVRAL